MISYIKGEYMKKISKVLYSIGISLMFASVNLSANSYMDKINNIFVDIQHKLGFNSNKQPDIKILSDEEISSEDIAKHKKKKKRFVKRKQEIDLEKFCFKDNRSIHYRADERCK